jgi:type I restriction-modification system DNA methylase subunit
MQKNTKQRTEHPNDIETPPALAEALYELVTSKYEINSILEPCSGSGALIQPFIDNDFDDDLVIFDYEIKCDRDFFKEKNLIWVDLVLANAPFNGYYDSDPKQDSLKLFDIEKPKKKKKGKSEEWLPLKFLKHIFHLCGEDVKMFYFCQSGFLLNMDYTAQRRPFFESIVKHITGRIILPRDCFPDRKIWSEIIIFNMPKLRPCYFYGNGGII